MKRFWDKVNKTDNCWEWTGCLRNGYGCFRVDGKVTDTHRYSYAIHFGPIPKDMCVLHKCDNRKCVRPDHLFLGTYADNYKDMCDKKRDGKLQAWTILVCPTCNKQYERLEHMVWSEIKRGHIGVTCSIKCGNKLDWQIRKDKSVLRILQQKAIIRHEKRYRV